MWWGRSKSFSGDRVVITGGSTGIGFALAQQFVSRGAHVTLIARTKSRLDSAVAELRQLARTIDGDPNIRAFPADTTDPSQVACMGSACACIMWHEPARDKSLEAPLTLTVCRRWQLL